MKSIEFSDVVWIAVGLSVTAWNVFVENALVAAMAGMASGGLITATAWRCFDFRHPLTEDDA